MDNTFELKKGKLVFETDKIVITDNAQYKRRYAIFQSVIALVLAGSFIFKYIKTGEKSSLTFAIFMGLFGLMKLLFELMKSAQSEISFKEVKSMKVKRILLNEFLAIRLNNNKTRQVSGILNAERLEDYINANQFK